MKKFLSLVLALVMTMSLVTVSAGAKDFTDNDAITYEEAVAVMSEIGVIDGYTTGDFKPTATLTRGAAAKIICNLILGPTTAGALAATTAPFSDVAADSTFAGYIAYLSKEGIIGGYADGTFKPGNSLTGYAFLKMLLGALGYDAAIEGYNGANYAVTVAKQAIEAGLTDGLVKEFDGRTAVTREEACLYAFNTLQAIMVEYDNRIVVGEGATAVAISGVRKDLSWNKGTKNDGNIEDDGYVQFAEQYFPKLVKTDSSDVFGRPAHTWTFSNDKIGTFVDWTEMVAEYTTEATGKEMYDAIGSTAFKYDFAGYVNGNASKFYTYIAKTNKSTVSPTADGALTQIFVDADNKEVVVTVINTYLAKATADYNAKKDVLTLDVYGCDDASSAKVSSEDFDVEDVKKGEFFLVTYADDAIQSMDAVEVLEGVEIETFSRSNSKVTSVTVDGTKYNDSAKLAHDSEVLESYTNANLKDATYNVYLDAYGYVIGVEEVEKADNYVFITGVEGAYSNLSTATWEANAIFMDGTCQVIDVKNNGKVESSPMINAWFTYTVNAKGVYTLTPVAEKLDDANKVDVAWNQTTDVAKLDSTHIWLRSIDTTYGKIYGNDDTVYLIAELDTVKSVDENRNATYYGVIKDVDEVVVGADNVSVDIKNSAKVADDLSDAKKDITVDADNASGGAYALYDDDGYIIAVVVVGENGSVSSNIAYALGDGINSESYKDGKWTWKTDVVINGEKVTLTESNDEDASVLETDVTKATWYNVKYDADGNVKTVVPLTTETTKPATYVKSFNAAVLAVQDDTDVVVLDVEGVTSYSISGKTLYQDTLDATGLRVAEDVKIVLIQTVNNKKTTSYETGVDTLKSILKDLNEVDTDSKTDKGYNFDAVIENGKVTSVIIVDNNADNAYTGPSASINGDITLVTFNESTRKATMKYNNTVVTDPETVMDFIRVVLTEKGYTWTGVTGSNGVYTATVLMQGNDSAVTFTFTNVYDK